MDSNTAGIGVDGLPVERASKTKNPFLFILAALILVGIVLLALPFINNFLSNQKGKPISNGQADLSVDQKKKAMERTIKSTFTSAQDKNIISWINLASTEKDPGKQYSHYVKAFSNIVSSYKLTKPDSEKRKKEEVAILALKSYVSILPGYRESDFVIPK